MNVPIFSQIMGQQEEPAGAEPGEGEVAGAPPDPAPIVEILPLVEALAEEEDTPAPVIDVADVDDPPADNPPKGLHMALELARGLTEATSNIVVGRRISGQQGGTALTAVPQPSMSLALPPSSGSPPGSVQNPMCIGLLLPPLQPPLEEGVVCRRWSTLAPTSPGTPPLLSYMSATTC